MFNRFLNRPLLLTLGVLNPLIIVRAVSATRFYNKNWCQTVSSEVLQKAEESAEKLGLGNEFRELEKLVRCSVGDNSFKYGHLVWIFDKLLKHRTKAQGFEVLPVPRFDEYFIEA